MAELVQSGGGSQEQRQYAKGLLNTWARDNNLGRLRSLVEHLVAKQPLADLGDPDPAHFLRWLDESSVEAQILNDPALFEEAGRPSLIVCVFRC